ncbi:SEC-C metal-binding domain-containing protein [Caulobacter sp. BE254]|uniref:SEC-C metal-binding domain-containing protein n=1 Tax=Caulobacter sp. BE254 TaxID=2817720 RepID=UPI003857C25F
MFSSEPSEPEARSVEDERQQLDRRATTTADPLRVGSLRASAVSRVNAAEEKGKIGVNAPCPCGSGRKYKRCHGA